MISKHTDRVQVLKQTLKNGPINANPLQENEVYANDIRPEEISFENIGKNTTSSGSTE